MKLANLNIENNNYEASFEIYKDILTSKKLDNTYTSMLAINAAYNFLDLSFKNLISDRKQKIDFLINLIDDDLENYIGNKQELIFLSSILFLDDEMKYKNDKNLLQQYENIKNNEKISSSIKERLKKIHEYLLHI